MNKSSRRTFLKAVGLGALSASGLIPSISYSMSPSGDSNGVVVLVFLRGGCDGLHMLMPSGNSDQAKLSDLRPNLLPGENDTSYINVNNDFSMHPKMAPLQRAINDNCLSFFPATHCGINLSTGIDDENYASMSHFTNQKILEFGGGINSLKSIVDDLDESLKPQGWIARISENSNISSNSEAISKFGFARVDTFNGDNEVMILKDISKTMTKNTFDKVLVEKALDSNRISQSPSSTTLEQEVFKVEELVTKKIEKLNKVTSQEPSNYDENYINTSFGRQLAQAARMIVGQNSIPELEFISCDLGGFDHHANLKPQLDRKLNDLATNLSTFYEDIKTADKKVKVIVMTEFGRTVDENNDDDTAGTDHGQAFTAMVLSNQATGKASVRYGNRFPSNPGVWPSLDSLVQERRGRHYLDAVTDYRDIICETVSETLDHDPAYSVSTLENKFYDSDELYSRMDIS